MKNPDAIRIAPSLDGLVKPLKPKKVKSETADPMIISENTNETHKSANSSPTTAKKTTPGDVPAAKKVKIDTKPDVPKITTFAAKINAKKIEKRLGESVVLTDDEVENSSQKKTSPKKSPPKAKRSEADKPVRKTKSTKKIVISSSEGEDESSSSESSEPTSSS